MQLGSSTHMRSKPLKGQHVGFLIPPPLRQKSKAAAFSFRFFYPRSRLVYLFWNVITGCWMGGGAPFAHMSYFIKGRFLRVCLQGIILSSLNSQMTGWYWNLSFFSLSPSPPFLCEAVRGGMCCDGRCGLVQTEPVVRRPTVTCRHKAKTKRAHLNTSLLPCFLCHTLIILHLTPADTRISIWHFLIPHTNTNTRTVDTFLS